MTDQQPRTAAQQCKCGHYDINHWLSGKGSCAIAECDCNGFYLAESVDTVVAEEVATDLGAQIAALRDTVAALQEELSDWTQLVHARLNTHSQMISKAGTDCDICEGRGWSINVPSQTMYPCSWCNGKGKVNIAELRDTVDELSSKFSNANDVIDRRLTALESPASAPEFAPDPNNKRTRPRTSITDDIEELWPQLEAGIRYLGRKSEPEPPAAVPEPEPDPLCQCGHAARWHNDHKRKCNHVESLRPYVRCACEQFVPQPSPATAHQEPPDAVLVAIISDAKRRWSRDDYGTETQDEEIALSVTEYFRNKYGRDGAR